MRTIYRISICTLIAAFAAGGFPKYSYSAEPQRPDIETPEQHAMRMMQSFDDRFAIMDSLIFGAARSADIPVEAADIPVTSVITGSRNEAIDEVTEAEIDAMKARTGLELRGQAYARPGRQISYDPDDPLVAYNAKLQIELNWDIFNSSIYKRRSKSEELRLKGELRQMETERESREQTLYMQSNAMRSRHYGRMLSLLKLHSENLQLLMEAQLYLLRNGKISSDDLVKIINEQSEIERRLVVLNADSTVRELPVTPSATYVFVADTAALYDGIREQHRDLRKLSLQQQLLDAQRKNIDYAQTMNVAPFVRWSYYNRYMVRNTYNLDVGVSFRLPLTAETARKRSALSAEKRVIADKHEQSADLILRDVKDLLRELDNNNENMCGEFERMRNLKEYLIMRIDGYNNVAGDYSRVDRLQEYNAYLQSWERLLGYAYQRDCLLIELQGFLPDQPIADFLIFQELN